MDDFIESSYHLEYLEPKNYSAFLEYAMLCGSGSSWYLTHDVRIWGPVVQQVWWREGGLKVRDFREEN